MEKDRIIELKIDDMLDDGRAFGRCGGFAVFAGAGGKSCRSAVPGDVIRARVTKVRKSAAEAVVEDLIEPSPDRIPSDCPYFGECGGCTLRELSYEAQMRLKTEQLRAKLERLGGVRNPKVNECIGAKTLDYYRNKAVFAVGPHGEVGFRKAKSRFVMDIDDCLLQSDAAMVCADALRAFLRGQRSARKGEARITGLTVKTAFGTGEVMAVIETEADSSDPFSIEGIGTLIEMMDDAVYSLSSDENAKTPAFSLESVGVISRGKCRVIAGKPTITEEFITGEGGALQFEISPQSFFQVNPEQMAKLYDKTAEYAGVQDAEPAGAGRMILDLYCGTGTIGIWLLDKLRRSSSEAFEKTRVIGIESVKSAVIDANRNSVINGLINTRYFCGKAEEELPGMMGLARLYKRNEVNERVEREPELRIEHADVAVLDPPRAGCGEALLAAVAAAQPDRIVYVSCDPGTLARDIRYLCASGYDFIEATPVDQFPFTSSCEAAALLKRSSSPQQSREGLGGHLEGHREN